MVNFIAIIVVLFNCRGDAKSSLQIRHSRILGFRLFAILAISLTSCGQMPSHSGVHPERFRNETLFTTNIHIVAYSYSESSQNIGKSLSENLVYQFQKQGISATFDIQQRNSPSLVGIDSIAKFSPDATVLIRFGKSYSSSAGDQNWTVTFDVLDAQSRGVWKGIVLLHRLDKIQEASASICIQVVSNLIDSGIISNKSKREIAK